MTDNNIDLTRRKVLGSIGAVGVAGAVTGYGTTAYFSDEESFTDNTLTAGALDLKVDWEEHYNYPQLLGFDDPAANLEYAPVTDLADIPNGTDPDGWKPFPPGTSDSDDTPDPLLYVYDGNEAATTDVEQYMRDTAIEGFPDGDNDGTAEFPVEEMLPDLSPCEVLADVPEDYGRYTSFDGEERATLGRTDNDDTRTDEGEPAPLINLKDVKPGDFGEITFSTHLCDNPAYLWMRMPGGLDLDENGITGPEGESDLEEEGVVELADEIQTTIWYDNNCNNLIDEEEKLDIMALADTSGSQSGDNMDTIEEAANVFINNLPDDQIDGEDRVRAGLLTFNGEGDAGSEIDQGPVLQATIGPLSQFDDNGGNTDVGQYLPETGIGNTPMPHALDLGRQVLNDRGRADARQIILLVTDGLPDYSHNTAYTVEDPDDSSITYTSGNTPQYGSLDAGSGTPNAASCTELDETGDVADDVKGEGIDILGVGIDLGDTDCNEGNGIIGGDTFLQCQVTGLEPSPSTCEPNQFFDVDNYTDLEDVAIDIAQQLVGGQNAGDQIIFNGTLREAEAVLTEQEGVALDADRDAEGRQCFQPWQTHCFGFSWWLPTDVENHVQSDAAAFDLGFYAEQCRHNDGEGESA